MTLPAADKDIAGMSRKNTSHLHKNYEEKLYVP